MIEERREEIRKELAFKTELNRLLLEPPNPENARQIQILIDGGTD